MTRTMNSKGRMIVTRIRLGLLLAMVTVLSACGVAQLPWAPDAEVARARYHDPSPSSITLMTVVANGSTAAGHSALLINASERVIYDPAGTWYNKDVPERADMLYGITPKMLKYYLDYHARDRFHVVMQTKVVAPEVAEHIKQLAIQKGTSMNAMCAQNTSDLLAHTPGFEGFKVSVWPKSAVAEMSRVPGVVTKTIYQDDKGKDLKS